MYYLMIKLPFEIVIILKTPFNNETDALEWAIKHPPFNAFSVVTEDEAKTVKRPVWVPLKKNGRRLHD